MSTSAKVALGLAALAAGGAVIYATTREEAPKPKPATYTGPKPTGQTYTGPMPGQPYMGPMP